MNETRTLKLNRLACTLAMFALAATPAFAVNKDMVQLQTEVNDLQQAVAHLQQSNDERMGVLKDLVQQTADSVNKMSVTVEGLQQQMRAQQEASTTKLDGVSGQVQSLNDSLDEVKARLNGMEKALQAVQGQQQSINATLQNLTPPAATAPAANPDGTPVAPSNVPQSPVQPAPIASASKPSPDIPFAPTQGPYANAPQAPAAAAPPISDLYSAALKDYEAAKYGLATTEFNQVIHAYPSDPLAGNSYYYLGEIDYRAGHFSAAIKDYDHVLDQYPGNAKIPVSHLHKGMALLSIKERDAGIAELRALIQRFPNSAEAVQARSKLNGMGVRPVPARNE
jgi:tol-pal system protein YbgF